MSTPRLMSVVFVYTIFIFCSDHLCNKFKNHYVFETFNQLSQTPTPHIRIWGGCKRHSKGVELSNHEGIIYLVFSYKSKFNLETFKVYTKAKLKDFLENCYINQN